MNLGHFTKCKKKDADLVEEIDSHLAHEQDANAARDFRQRRRAAKRG